MPAIRTHNRLRSPTTGQVLSATTDQILSHSRPVRLTRQSYRLGYRIWDFYDTDAQATAPLTATASSSTSVFCLPETPPATPPPTTAPESDDTDLTPMSISVVTSCLRSTQPSTPTTPTPAGRGAPAKRKTLQRTYSVILSPGDVSMQTLSPVSTTGGSGVDHTPQNEAGNWFDEIMGVGEDGEDECPRYGKMSQLRPFKMSDITFDQFSPDELPEPDTSMLTRMDRLTNAGLSPTDFQRAFIQCWKCNGVVARRNAHFHSCALVKASKEFAPLDRVELLHCTGTEGLTNRSFEALMSYCRDCDKFMTYRASLHHDCVFFDTYLGEDLAEEVAMETDLV